MNKIILTQEPQKKKLLTKSNIIRLLIFLIIILFTGYAVKLFMFTQSIGIKINTGDIINPIKTDPALKRDSSGKYTNAMIVGIDTKNSQSDLKNTDTIIIASYNHDTNETMMISIPRDFYVKVPNEEWYTKINGIYQEGEKNKIGGLNLLQNVVETVTGYEIQYYVMVDLQGFVEIINTVGGITINVENTFIDYRYPNEAGTSAIYETISFTKGIQKMDGKTALKYARSRQSVNAIEASDFARSRRQQKVIIALKDKILSTDTLLNPGKILDILSTIEKYVQLSDFTSEDIQAIINLAKKQQETKSEISSFVLDPSIANSTLVTANGFNIGDLYVIGPKEGLNNYSQIIDFFEQAATNPRLYSEDPTIKIYNTGLQLHLHQFIKQCC